MTGDFESEVARALDSFDENKSVDPYKTYRTPEEIDGMAHHFRFNSSELHPLAQDMEQWRGCPGGVDECGLHAISTSNPLGRWDWYEIGGRFSGMIPSHTTISQALIDSGKESIHLPSAFIDRRWGWHDRPVGASTSFITDTNRGESYDHRREELWWSLRSDPRARIVCADIHH
jgi:hypothetical protein